MLRHNSYIQTFRPSVSSSQLAHYDDGDNSSVRNVGADPLDYIVLHSKNAAIINLSQNNWRKRI